jgi:hypothetical protein
MYVWSVYLEQHVSQNSSYDGIPLPIGLCAIIDIGEILNRQPVKLLMLSQSLYNVPAQTIYIDPPALDPAVLRFGYEVDEFRIVEIMNIDIVLTEIHNRDLTCFVEIGSVRPSTIRFGGVETWLLAWMPIRSQRSHVHSLEA